MGWVTLDDGQHVLIGSSGKVAATRAQISSASGGKERGKALAGRSKGAVARAVAKARASKAKPSLREQAEKARAAKGMSPEDRKLAANVKYSFWRSNAPTSGLGASSYKKQEAASKAINEGAKKAPDVYAKARSAVDAKIEAFRAKRLTPELTMSQHGAKLKVKEYDQWQQFKGTKTVTPNEPEHSWQRQHSDLGDPHDYYKNKAKWTDRDYKEVQGIIKSGGAPDWMKHQARDYKAGTHESLVPSKPEIDKQRKAQGIKGRFKDNKIEAVVRKAKLRVSLAQ